MVPVVNGIAPEYEGIVEFAIIDVGVRGGSDLANRLNVQYLPTFVMVNGDGSVAQTIIGTMSEDDLRAALDALE